jgi:hypothetical protein
MEEFISQRRKMDLSPDAQSESMLTEDKLEEAEQFKK